MPASAIVMLVITVGVLFGGLAFFCYKAISAKDK